MPDPVIRGSRELTFIIRKCILTGDFKACIMCATIDDAFSAADSIYDEFKDVKDNLKIDMPILSFECIITKNMVEEGARIVFASGSSIDCVVANVIARRDSELILWPPGRRARDTKYDAVIVDSGVDLTDVRILRMFFTNPPENGDICLSVDEYDSAVLNDVLAQQDKDTSQELDSFLAEFKITKEAR